jgi:probable HAF family extracellular repeat protein
VRLRLLTLTALWGAIALVVGACGPPVQDPGEARSDGSESAPVRESSTSPSNPATPTSLDPCARPDVLPAKPAASGGRLRYRVTALELPVPSTDFSYATLAINDAGQVSGTARIDGANGFDRAYRWTPGGRIDYIVGAEGQTTTASDVNASGQVAGDIWGWPDGPQPFVWDEQEGLRVLDTGVRTTLDDVVYDVRLNDAGQVAGTVDVSGSLELDSGGYVTFRMEPDGTVSHAPVAEAEARDMNATGEVVLTVDNNDETAELYVWQSGTTLIDGGPVVSWSQARINDAGLVVAASPQPGDEDDDFEDCGFAWDTRTGSRTVLGLGVHPYAVNMQGQVTGSLHVDDGWHAFLWDSGSGLADLGTVPGFDDGSAGQLINDRGQVAGYASLSRQGGEELETSFLWDPSGGLVELRPLSPDESTYVFGINNEGVVVGVSGPLDPEEGLIREGKPVIWSPTR